MQRSPERYAPQHNPTGRYTGQTYGLYGVGWVVVKNYHPEYEVAAYTLSEMLGFNIVPVTVKRKMTVLGQKDTYSLQQFIADAEDYSTYEDRMYDENESTIKVNNLDSFLQMRIMDYIIANTDRHTGNYLIDLMNERVIAIDHSHTFRYPRYFSREKSYTLADYKVTRVEDEWVERIANLLINYKETYKVFKELVGQDSARRMMYRLKRAIDF